MTRVPPSPSSLRSPAPSPSPPLAAGKKMRGSAGVRGSGRVNAFARLTNCVRTTAEQRSARYSVSLAGGCDLQPPQSSDLDERRLEVDVPGGARGGSPGVEVTSMLGGRSRTVAGVLAPEGASSAPSSRRVICGSGEAAASPRSGSTSACAACASSFSVALLRREPGRVKMAGLREARAESGLPRRRDDGVPGPFPGPFVLRATSDTSSMRVGCRMPK
mmetsp:Transcript_18560/g.56683  ORF Transcript_18560/g.56683 Transcript_18560/m.56683 type:complete len:218 (+) Transcript_18560:543-1196(+)